MPPLLSIDEALARVLARVRPLESEPVPVAEAAGRVLAEDVAARSTCRRFRAPRWTASRSGPADVPGELPVVFRIAAGRPAERPLEAGEAMEISTGGTVPAGADAVVPIENVVENDNSVQVPDPVAAGAHIRPIGGDVARRRCPARRRDRARRRSDRRARRRRDRRGLVQPPAQGGRSQHRHRAPRAGRGARPGADLRVERPDARGGVRGRRRAGRPDRPGRRRRGGAPRARSSGGSRPTFS